MNIVRFNHQNQATKVFPDRTAVALIQMLRPFNVEGNFSSRTPRPAKGIKNLTLSFFFNDSVLQQTIQYTTITILSSQYPERYLFVETTLLMESKNNAETNYKSSCLKTLSIAKKTFRNSELEKLIRALLQRFPLRQ